MVTENLERTMAQMLERCERLPLRLAQLAEEDMAKPTTRRWAPTVGDFLTGTARHKRDHAQQITAKRQALGLEQTPVQKALADVAAAQAELYGALIGLADEDLEQVPEGQNWSIAQVLEHMSRSDGSFLPEIEKALTG
jgi:hypothetical protein